MTNNNNIRTFILSILLIILPISSSLCIDMYLPAYGSIAHSFSVTEGSVNLSMSIYLFGLAIGQLLYGPISDRFGRKITLLVGLAFFAVASLFCMIAPTLPIFLIARLLQALGACSSIVLCRTIVTDSYHPEKRTAILALISATNIFSPAIAPLLGGFVIKFWNWRWIFLIITCFAVLMSIGMLIVLRETLLTPDPNALKLFRMIQNAKRLFTNRLYAGYVFCLASLYATVFVWVTYSPGILIDHFHVSPDDFGLYFLMPSLGSTCGALFTARFSGIFSGKRIAQLGLSIIFAAVVLLNLFVFNHKVTAPVYMVLFIMMIFFGTGMTSPQLISDALSQFIEIGGFASGILGFLQTTSGSSMGVITSSLYANSFYRLPLLMAAAILIALLFFGLATFHRKRTDLVVIKKNRFPATLRRPHLPRWVKLHKKK